MRRLSSLFKPITANPESTPEYIEILPSDLLKPYIRCFWGTPYPILKYAQNSSIPKPTLVIPDTCMDIILDIDYTSHKTSNVFCGINDGPFLASAENKTVLTATFGIRFYFWAVHLFVDMGMQEILNAYVETSCYFSDFINKLESVLIEKTTITERITEAEKYLLTRLAASVRTNNNVMQAVYLILNAKGLISVSELCGEINVSQRHLQRLFNDFVGVSPKKVADLVRFQNIWQELFYARKPNFGDIAYYYNYTDQSHFNHDFKKYAGRTPQEALQNAQKNGQ